MDEDEELYDDEEDDEEDYEPDSGDFEEEYEDDEELIDGVGFADPGGNSALRAATPSNPRNLPCPSCGMEDRLTPKDVARGYQCDSCANQAERGY